MSESLRLTELDAAAAYARAWNRLDSSIFVALLAPDSAFASQWVFDELNGKDAIAAYLAGKMQSVETSGAMAYAELAKTLTGAPGRDCVALAQGRKESVDAIVLFDVQNNVVKRVDLCMPELYQVVRSGDYPN